MHYFARGPAGCLACWANGIPLIIRKTFKNCQHFNYENVRLIVAL